MSDKYKGIKIELVEKPHTRVDHFGDSYKSTESKYKVKRNLF